MSTTFLITFALCVITLIYWRVALIIFLAIFITLVLSGLNTIAQAVDGMHEQPTTGAPAQQGTSSDGPGKSPGSEPGGSTAPPN